MGDDIAIVGLGVKVPDAEDLDQFWKNLVEKKNSIREVPEERWNLKKFINADGKRGTCYSGWGSFIDDMEHFDPTPFRGISSLEVAAMDPQQRWMLQCCWQAFEDAGIDAYSGDVDGSRTGVFVGLMNHDYMGQLSDMDDIDHANNTFITGISGSICPNRVSYVFNLLGPSFTVDTACSSSIVALHQAVQAIKNNECDSALVGGVNMINSPAHYILLSQAKMMSRTGGCKAFDERGDGYTRGEGCGVLLLKRLSDAVKDKNKIYAVIKATGINSDGRTQAPMTSPSEVQQYKLMEDVYTKHNIDPSTISYIESHGTGTPVGDPVEARAIGRFLGSGSSRTDKLWMGSVKTNIGHLESGSGVAGLIKICLMLKNKTIAPNLYFDTPNPNIPFSELKLDVPTQPHPWPAPPQGAKHARRAALNCFGFGGTNGHAILEEYVPPSSNKETELHEVFKQHYAITFSGVDPSALKDAASAMHERILNDPNVRLEDLGYSSFRRTHLKERAVIFPSSREHALDLLAAFNDDAKVADLEKQGFLHKGSSQGDKRICFVFSGQGTFWAGVGKVLLATQPIFNAAIKEVDSYLEPLAGWSVWKTLSESVEDDTIPIPQYTATVSIFAMQIALVRLMANWNVKPDFIVGHSVGETAASVVSGAVTLKDGVTLVHHRARLQSQLEGSGRIAAVAISQKEAEEFLKPYDGKLEIAAVNSPESVTIAGDAQCFVDFEAKFRAAHPSKVFVFLRLNCPYHTSFMEPMKKEFLELCGGIQSQTPTTTIYSTVTGRKFEPGNYTGQYFWQNIREPVYLSQAIQNLTKEEGVSIFLEIGPHPALGLNVVQCNKEFSPKKAWHVIGTLTKKDRRWSAILRSLARLHITSVAVDWTVLYEPYKPNLVTLPNYQWRKKRYWIEGPHVQHIRHADNSLGSFFPGGASGSRAGGMVRHPFLKTPSAIENVKKGWALELNINDFPYLKDHDILGTLVLAATCSLEYIIAAAHELRDSTGDYANKYAVGAYLVVENPVLVTPANPPVLRMDIDGNSLELGAKVPFKLVQSAKDANSKEAGSGRGSLFVVPAKEAHHSVKTLANEIIDDVLQDESRSDKKFKKVPGEELYAIAKKAEYNFGPAHKAVNTAWVENEATKAVGFIEVPESLQDSWSDYYLHPALFDAIFHPSILCRTDGDATLVPTSIQVIFYNKPKSNKLWGVFRSVKTVQKLFFGEFILLDEDRKTVIFHIPAFLAKPMNAPTGVGTYEQIWTPTPAIPLNTEYYHNPRKILVFASKNDLGAQVVKRLRSENKKNVIAAVYAGDKNSQKSENEWEVDPFDEYGIESIINDTVLSPDTDVWDAIVYLWPTEEVLTENQKLDMGYKTCAGFLHMLKPLLNGSKNSHPRVLGVTSGAFHIFGEKQLNVAQSTIWGFSRSAILEYPDLKLAMLDVDPLVYRESASALTGVDQILAELASTEGHWDETAYRGEGGCFKNVFQDATAQFLFGTESGPGVSRIDSVGMRYSPNGKLAFSTNPEISAPADNQVRVSTKTCGVLPAKLASGLPLLNTGGISAVSLAGEVAIPNQSRNLLAGDNILAVGLLPLGNESNIDCDAIIRKPQNWSDAQSATVPAILSIAYYVINYESLVRSRDCVLIVGDLAGLGVAASLLVKDIAKKVYAIVPEESVKHVTALGVNAISLNNTTYTWGKNEPAPRFDVVLSFLENSNDEVYSSLHTQLSTLLKPKARYVGLTKNGKLEENSSSFDVSQKTFDLSFFGNSEIVAEIVEAISAVFHEFPIGAVNPDIYPVSKIADVDLTSSTNNSIAVDFEKIEEIAPNHIDYIPNFRRDATYVIVGGLRGLGLTTANYAVVNGARHIVLVGRSKPDADAQKMISAMKARGADVIIANGSVTDEKFVAGLFQKIKKEMPPLRGVFHSAVVLMDQLVVKHGWSEFAQVLEPKVGGAWLLHKHTLGTPLDFFVLYSSMTSVMGNVGQVAYGAGNAFMDALAQHRRILGLPTIAFNWGGVSDIGVLARASGDVAEMLDKTGNHLLTPSEVLTALGDNLYSSRSGISVLRIDWQKYFSINPILASRVRYNSVKSASNSQGGETSTGSSDEVTVIKTIRASPDDAVQIIEEFLQQYFMKILEFTAPPDVDISIQHLGIESVLAAQMRAHIAVQLGVTMPVVWFFSNLTITDLAKRLLGLIPPEELRPVPKEVENSDEKTDGKDVEEANPNIIVSDLSLNQISIYKVSPPGSIDMNLYGYCVFPFKPAKRETVGQVIQAAVDHHPILKSAYKVRKTGAGEEPVQIVDLNAQAYVEYIDATHQTLEEVEEAIRLKANVPFDLTQGQLIKTFIYERENQMTIAFVFHHLLVDLISCFMFIEDVMNMWRSKQKLPKKDVVDHDEFVRWEKNWLVSADGKKAAEFWNTLTQDHNLIRPIEMKLKKINKSVPKGISILDIHLTAEEQIGFAALVKQLNTTPFIVLWVAYQILLAQGGETYGPVVMGSVFTTRANHLNKRIIGAFVNCLPLVNNISAQATLKEVVQSSTPVLTASMDNAAYHHTLIPKKEGANLLQHMIVDDRVQYDRGFTSLVTKIKFDTVSVNEDTQLKILTEPDDSNKIWMQLLLREDLFDQKARNTYNTMFKNILSDLFKNPNVAQSRIEKIGHN